MSANREPDNPQHAAQVSAGGVLFRRHENRIQVCLIAKHAGRVWSLPKGRLDEAEPPEHAAVREVLEETGHIGRIIETLGDIRYEFLWKTNNTQYHKSVTYYLMALVQSDAQSRDQEADQVEWVDLTAAIDRITHDNERAIVRTAQTLMAREEIRLEEAPP